MALVKVVTGYIDIPGHPRGTADYRALGDQLFAATEQYQSLVFDSKLSTPASTWLADYVKGRANITHSVADNPAKNTLAYHCVQHEKFAWLANAAELDVGHPGGASYQSADIYVWIDFGIFHVPGVTAAVIQKYLAKIENHGGAVMMPGCWQRGPVPIDVPSWRFCGGLIAVPRPLVKTFAHAALSVACKQINATNNVEWEVNTLARLELLDALPIGWYAADHNEKMFEALP